MKKNTFTQSQPRSLSNAYANSRSRNQHELAEDYVELIDDLIQQNGEARAVDLARHLGVSHVTVSKTIGRLKDAGLVNSQPYRSIFLTPEGHELADASRARHQIVLNFLRAIGISKQTAEQDAEGIEHYASDETLTAFSQFVVQSKK